jgi:adenine-specific DNA methylase
MGDTLGDVTDARRDAIVVLGDASSTMDAMPPGSAQLVLADPPHTDRVPYLELSAMWNALLNLEPVYDDELVVSNARGRAKSLEVYAEALAGTLRSAGRILHPSGHLALFFNSSRVRDWTMLAEVIRHAPEVRYLGAVPMEYSAGSVVQDNRDGALKHDFVLLFSQNAGRDLGVPASMRDLPGWTDSPTPGFLAAVS